MSRPDGRRGRRKPDPAEETASWLLEMQQVARRDESDGSDEEDWAEKLRATRREATGQFPAVPVEGPGGAAPQPAPAPRPPPEPVPRPRSADEPVVPETGSWFAPEPEPPAAPALDYGAGSWADAAPAPTSAWDTADPYVQPAPGAPEPQLGAREPWAQADPLPATEPTPQEPPVWDTLADPTSWGGGKWPFEETSQSWEADDRSYTWPVQELPANTGSWEAPAEPSWRQDDPWGPATPRFEAEPTAGYPTPDPGGYPAPPADPYRPAARSARARPDGSTTAATPTAAPGGPAWSR